MRNLRGVYELANFNSEVTLFHSHLANTVNVLCTVLFKLHMCPITLHVATAKGSWQFRMSRRQTSTSP